MNHCTVVLQGISKSLCKLLPHYANLELGTDNLSPTTKTDSL
jgi:hypothetical protein